MDKKSKDDKQPHYLGHRKRLKDKFLSNARSTLGDYELLELLLFQSIPRRDVKPLAKSLLQKFGGLRQLVHADKEMIMSVDDMTEGSFLQLKIIQEMLSRILYEEVQNKNVISSWGALLDYLKFNMGCLKIEQFRVLFLNKRNALIADEVMATGTIDQTPVYPREIVKKALFYEAGAIILVHNHPSGNPDPSKADIELTRQISTACKTINVTLHDHVIIASNNYYSFKTNRLL
ncbi:MAG: hypothetical protein COA94_04270 [Rickettsiales bacterium]|nr:MAG: hypothetical protein COA94_04270 [Rickettsiales bacterium]